MYSGKAMAPTSSTFAWKIPWAEEHGRLQSMGSLRVRHDWVTLLLLFTFMHWRRKWQPAPVFLPGESQGWWSLVGCCLWGHRVGHDWSDLAAIDAEDSKKRWQEYTEGVYKKELHDSDNHNALLTHLECNAKSSGLKGHYEKKLMEGMESSCQVWMWEFDYKEVWVLKNWCFWTVLL